MMVRTLLDAYEGLVMDREPVATAPSTAYGDFCIEQYQRDTGAATEFWRDELAGVALPGASITLPAEQRGTDEPVPVLQERILVPAETAAGLYALARGNELSVNTVVYGAWALMVSAITGSSEVVCGALLSGRSTTTVDVDSAAGLMFNILPVATPVDATAGLVPWLAGVQAKISAISDNEYLSPHALRELVGLPADEPLFESYVVNENVPGMPASLGRLMSVLGAATPVQVLAQTEHPLRVEIHFTDHFSLIAANHRAGYFPPGAVAHWLDEYVALLTAMVAQPDRTVGDLVGERAAQVGRAQ